LIVGPVTFHGDTPLSVLGISISYWAKQYFLPLIRGSKQVVSAVGFSAVQIFFENQLRFDKVTESLNVETFWDVVQLIK